MSDLLKTLLKQADPAADDAGIPRHEAARMKRAVVEAAEEPSPVPSWIPVAAGSALAVMVAALILFADLPLERTSRANGPVPARDANLAVREITGRPQETVPARKAVRRIDFVTPGGTRILWTLDPDFDV